MVERVESIPDTTGYLRPPERDVNLFVNQIEQMQLRPSRTADLGEVRPLIEVRDVKGRTLFRLKLLVRDNVHLEFPEELGAFEWMRLERQQFRMVVREIELVERFITNVLPRKKRPKDQYDPTAIAEVLKHDEELVEEIAMAPEFEGALGTRPSVIVALARPVRDLYDTQQQVAIVLGNVCVMIS